MTTATQIQRMGKNIKSEAITALYRTIDGLFSEYGEWVVSGDMKVIENDEYLSGVQYYRNGDEVIAVPTFYLYEGDGSTFIGSRGGEYILTGETLEVV